MYMKNISLFELKKTLAISARIEIAISYKVTKQGKKQLVYAHRLFLYLI